MPASFWKVRVLKIKFFQNHALSTTTANCVNLKVASYGCAMGKEVTRYTWLSKSGFSLSAIDYGAIITGIRVPDRQRRLEDIVLGFDDINGWVYSNAPYFGAAIGRCANRIGNAQFKLGGQMYTLAKNDGENHLHGGALGFDKKVWKSTVEGTKVTFSRLSMDGEEKYPGDLVVNVTYDVHEDPDALYMHFFATTNAPTIVNLTNHSYFNLGGHGSGPQGVYDTFVTINADMVTEPGPGGIPTGNLLLVRNTPFDLRIAKKLGDLIRNSNLFDINYCVNTCSNPTKELHFVARASHPPSGRYMEIFSDQPGCHFYTGTGLPSKGQPAIKGKCCATYYRHGAFCLETHLFPDAINHFNFPSPIIVPGEAYEHRVSYTFGVDDKR